MGEPVKRTIVIEATLFIVLGAVGIMEGLRLNRQPTDLFQMLGPGGYILVLGLVLMMTGAAHFIVDYGKSRSAEKEAVSTKERIRVAGLVVLLVGNIFLVEFAGYLVASIVFFSLTFKISGVRSWRTNIILGLCSAAAFYVVFVRLFDVIFPYGILFG